MLGTWFAGKAESPHGGAGSPTICLSCHNAHYAPFGPLLSTPNDDRNCYFCHMDKDGPVFDRATYEASKHYSQPDAAAKPASMVEAKPAEAPAAVALPERIPGVRLLRRDLLRLERAEAELMAKRAAGKVDEGAEMDETAAQPDEQVGKTCVKCHNPHSKATGGAQKLLRGATPQNSSGACAACHPVAGKARTFKGVDVYRRASAHANSAKGAKWPGAPYEPGECVNCHDPHGTSFPNMLRRNGLDTCYICHVKTDATPSLWPGDKTFKKSAHAKNCVDCHNPHGVVDPKTNKPYAKMLTKGEGGQFCFACHKEIATQYADAAIKGGGVTSRHPADTPGGKVKCVDCHNPHVVRVKDVGGYEPTLSDPDKSSKPFYWYQGNASWEFCLKCHDGSWKGAPDITAEMKEKTALNSQFVRTSDKVSLHNLHLTRYHKQKCSSCHAPHASEGTGEINRGRLLYGMTVNDFDGGYEGFNSCETGCHTKRCGSCHALPK